MLASSTKATVRGDDLIPLNPAWMKEWKETEWGKKTASGEDPPLPTFKDASLASKFLSTYIPDPSDSTEKSGHFSVPPITFLNRHAKPGAPIMPLDLHPFLNIDVIKQLGSRSDLDRGRLFEKPFMYAVYARYLLDFWKGTNKEKLAS